MRNQIVTIDGKKGEYTGFSVINGATIHYFSMYDGSVIRRTSLEGLAVTPFLSQELGGKFAYGCTRP